MAKLSVYDNGYEWVVATSVEDCAIAMKESIGAVYTPEDEIEWDRMDDEATITILMLNEHIADDSLEGIELLQLSEPIKKTCREWIEFNGRGFLASTEY